jgi:calcium-dependent protein kinase
LVTEFDFGDLDDKSGQLIEELQEIVKANNINLLNLFLTFDKDKQGTLDINEFSILIRKFAPKISDFDIQLSF